MTAMHRYWPHLKPICVADDIRMKLNHVGKGYLL